MHSCVGEHDASTSRTTGAAEVGLAHGGGDAGTFDATEASLRSAASEIATAAGKVKGKVKVKGKDLHPELSV